MTVRKKKLPRIVWEAGVLGILLLVVFSIQYTAPFFTLPGGQFVRTYASGSANYNLTAITAGTEGGFSNANYKLNIVSGDTGGVSQNSNYKLLLGSSNLIYGNFIVGNPMFFNHAEVPSHPANYTSSQIYQFRVNILGETPIDFVKFTLFKPTGESVFYTLGSGIIRQGDLYIANFANLPAGNYEYEWFARDQNGKTSLDTRRQYTINQASPGLTLSFNGIDNHIYVSDGTNVNILANSVNNPNLNIILFIDGQNTATDRGTLSYQFDSTLFGQGQHKILVKVLGDQNWTDQEMERDINVSSIGVSDIQVTPESGVFYKPVENYRFSSTWQGDVSDVVLEFNGVNYSMLKGDIVQTGTTYIKDFPNLKAGNYTYRWYSNDTVGTITATNEFIYEVKRAPVQISLFIDNKERSNIYVKDSTITLRANASVLDIPLSLIFKKPNGALTPRTGLGMIQTPEVVDQLGLYTITAHFGGNENYTEKNITRWVVGYDPNNPDIVSPKYNEISQNATKIFEEQSVRLWINMYDEHTLLDYAELKTNKTGTFGLENKVFVNAPFMNVTFNFTAPIGSAGKSIGWFVTFNDSFNFVTTSEARSFTVYDVADRNFDFNIGMVELSNAISAFLRGEISQTQIIRTIQRWLAGGYYGPIEPE